MKYTQIKPVIVLKIDVDTLRGTIEGVPRLMALLEKYQANATFLFSLGPDNTGKAIKRVFRPGFLNKVSRTSVVEHYGFKTLMYGTLLPAPDIGKKTKHLMRTVKEQGFDVGVHCWDHVLWQDYVVRKSEEWTLEQFHLAKHRFEEIFKIPPKTHGAAGWQMNLHALRYLERFGFQVCSDSRGTTPFIPVHKGEIFSCPQIPTTLPTLDELIGLNNITVHNVSEHLLNLTHMIPPLGHVFTLHAELEGMKLLPLFEKLLAGWKHQGYELVSLKEYVRLIKDVKLSYCEINLHGKVMGRSGTLVTQGEPILVMDRHSEH